MNSRHKASTGPLGIVVSFSCIICCAGVLIVYAFSSSENFFLTPTPIQALDTPLPIPTIIALTFSAAGTQTAMVSSPVPLLTATLAPSDNIPTATIFIFQLQTDMAQPTEYIYSTNTPFSLETPQPTVPPQSALCSCSDDTLNCSNFSYHVAAQACFNYCLSQGAGDIHKLDGDNDGDACESLP